MLGTPPSVALLLTVGFIVFLFWRDFHEARNVTGALWIPLMWVLLIGSRSIGQWLDILGVPLGNGSSTDEGNPIDALVFFGLIVAGLLVLNQRQLNLSEIFRNNGWLVAFLAFCFIAIIWSDFPFVAFKRWIKVLGHPIMALILFTEPDPEEALTTLIRRSAYVLVPFSVLFIKYYEGIGRKFDEWTGLATNRGVATNKNGLGCICLVLGFFFFLYFLRVWRAERTRARRNEILLIGGFLFWIWWLLWKAHSMTSLLSLVIGMILMVGLGSRFLNKRLIGLYLVLAVVALAVAELGFGIFEQIVDLTGHSTTVAGRENLWGELLAFHTNPIFGVGFESFWLGDRLQALWEAHFWHPTEAHNGYLETYLNLGLIGLFILLGLIIATFRKIRLDLLANPEWGRFRLGFLIAIVLYNWTEASFKGLSLLWFAFYIIALDYPKPEYETVMESGEASDPEDVELIVQNRL